jgi:GDSL-like Lipase/Acylhydrolase family
MACTSDQTASPAAGGNRDASQAAGGGAGAAAGNATDASGGADLANDGSIDHRDAGQDPATATTEGAGAGMAGTAGSDAGLADGRGDPEGSAVSGFDDAGSPDGTASGHDAGPDSTIAIMPLGDSITFGFNGTNAGYRGPLYNLLKGSLPHVMYVGSSVEGTVTTTTNALPADQRHNEGHGSYTIADIANNLDGLDRTEYDKYGEANRNPNGGHWFDGIPSGVNARPASYPDIVLLMIGTNDANDGDRTAVRNRIHALINKIVTMRPSTKLIVAQITPSNRPNNTSYNADVAREVALFQASGKHVSLVDMYTGFPGNGLYSDGVHPNDTGFAFMAQQWFTGIMAVR